MAHAVRRPTIPELTAEALRAGIRSGSWRRELPGVLRLAEELNVSKVTMRAALRLLEAEGVVAPEGPRGSRVVIGSRASKRSLARRVLVLFDRPESDMEPAERELILHLMQELRAADCECKLPPKSLVELQHQPEKILRYAGEVESDVWLVVGARKDVIETLRKSGRPVLSFCGGKVEGTPQIGKDMAAMVRESVRRFADLGHRKMVFILRERFQLPHSSVPREVLDELTRRGIPASAPYNTPVWAQQNGGLRSLLDEFFRVTPPTAIFVQNMKLLVALQLFLAERGVRVPADVSIICGYLDGECEIDLLPAHFRTDWKEVIRRAVQWVDGALRGHPTNECFLAQAQFHSGPSLGPAPADWMMGGYRGGDAFRENGGAVNRHGVSRKSGSAS